MLHYPVEFPGDAARLIVTNWRGGKIASEANATAEAAWNLVGYGLKASLGEAQTDGPANGNISMAAAPGENLLGGEVPDDEEMISKLEAFDSLPAANKLMAAAPGAGPIPPKILIKWAMNLAIKIISGMIV